MSKHERASMRRTCGIAQVATEAGTGSILISLQDTTVAWDVTQCLYRGSTVERGSREDGVLSVQLRPDWRLRSAHRALQCVSVRRFGIRLRKAQHE